MDGKQTHTKTPNGSVKILQTNTAGKKIIIGNTTVNKAPR